MELKTFVEQTIKEICDGVAAAKKAHTGGYSPVAPQINGILGKPSDRTKIHFELVVEASESTNAGGDGKINVLSVFSGGGKAECSENIKNTNKVSFDIPFAPEYLGEQN